MKLTNTQIKKLSTCKTNNDMERKLDQLCIEYDDIFAVAKTVFDPDDDFVFWGGDMDEFPMGHCVGEYETTCEECGGCK